MAEPVLLYIDDTRSDIELLRALLEPEGITVESARSGSSGIAAYDAGRHAAVVIDWNLCDMDGLQVARALLKKTPACPLAFVSGGRKEEDIAACHALGIYRYFEKSMQMDHVKNIQAFVGECARGNVKKAM